MRAEQLELLALPLSAFAMQIFVKTSTGKTIALEVERSDTTGVTRNVRLRKSRGAPARHAASSQVTGRPGFGHD